MRTKPSTKANGLKDSKSNMEREYKYGLMELSMKDGGITTKPTAMVGSFTLMETTTKVFGRMTRLKVLDPTFTKMEASMKVCGKMISSMAKVLKHG